MQKTNRTRRLVRCALLAAVYTVLCLVLGYASFGPVQFRIAEALVMLPVFGPEYIVSSVLGCFLANLLGSTPIDLVPDAAATLPAAAFNALTVGLGEIICCSVLGVGLVKLIETNPALREFFR